MMIKPWKMAVIVNEEAYERLCAIEEQVLVDSEMEGLLQRSMLGGAGGDADGRNCDARGGECVSLSHN